MKIVFRADASVAIGTGHVMRCLALARQLFCNGAEIVFVCRDEPGNLLDLIQQAGIVVHLLPALADLPGAWQDDAEATLAMLSGLQADWLIVDHYQLDLRWEQRLRAAATHIMVIDDLADRPHDCDLLLDQNVHPAGDARYDAMLPSACVRLLGPAYALLRPEFAQVREMLRTRDGRVRRLLVFFGGSDPGNETARALDALVLLALADMAVDVVVGSSNPCRLEIEQRCRQMPFVTFHCQVETMAALMAQADLFLGAGGSTAWERCCLGLPALVVVVAANQLAGSRALADAGALRLLGASNEVSTAAIAGALTALCADPAALSAMADAALRLVDGLGAGRVTELLASTWRAGMVVRLATPDDVLRQFAWRNAPEIRAVSFDDAPIALADHQRWFAAVLDDPQRHLLVALWLGEPIGTVRYDVRGDVAQVSVFLAPGWGGRGLGSLLLQTGSHWLTRNAPCVTTVSARILPDNLASRKAFAKAGYLPDGTYHVLDLVNFLNITSNGPL